MDFGKLVDGKLVYASKDAIFTDDGMVITNPTEEHYKKHGYKEVVIHSPDNDDKNYVPTYVEEDDKIIVDYKEE